MQEDLLKKITSLCKRRGFIYPGSEIYGGLANTWDYGPLGVQLKNNIKASWWKTFVEEREDMYGLDGGILMNPKVWEASGHLSGFVDVLVECKSCHKRFREDHLQGAKKCPECGGELTAPKKFVPMFKTFVGPVEGSASVAYLRPETAQAIFVNFKNIVDTFSPKLPFGIAQIGKSFRNEITLGNFIFRSLEFEQMEIEYFIEEPGWEKVYESWKAKMQSWVVGLGADPARLSWRAHGKEELSHYSKRTEDLEFAFSFGTKELYGLAYRANYDLTQHSKASGVEFACPHVVEPSMGVERTLLALLYSAYREEELANGKTRIYLKLSPQVAPYKLAVFPLVANKPEIVKKAREVFEANKTCWHTAWDDHGNVGKRYRRQDEIGTPWCVTVDYQTLEDNTVTIRDRDTMEQTRIEAPAISQYVFERLK
ncbi:MAG: glycine--tRNA ligase [bacterium]